MNRVGRWGPGLGTTLLALLLAGCGQYADFTLPRTPGGGPVAFAFEAQAEPVLTRGGTWDAKDVLNPSVVRGPSGLLNFYSGFDGRTWRTGVAESSDGIAWKKRPSLLEPDGQTWEGDYIAANGSAILHQGRYWYWYQAGPKPSPRIGLARWDGSGWTREAEPVLELGPYASWDERAVGDPYVVRVGSDFYMYYLGQDRARRQRLGVARSNDGIKWRKLRANPIMELGAPGSFDENGLGEPAVWMSHGFYWMLYTGRDVHENRRLGLARSTDGVHWQKLPAVFAGNQPWNSKVTCDPSVEVNGDEIRVWFGGGDVASPDENLNGQIGYALLRVTAGDAQ